MITKRMLTAFLSAALLLPVFAVTAVNGAENREVYDLNELSVFSGRTKEQLGQKYGEVFAQGPTYDSKDQSTWYSVMPSQQNPYEPGRLTDDTRRVMLAMTNYCRWLVGTTAYDHSDEHSDDLQAGALVRNFQFAHKVDDSNKPADMSDELWNQGKNVKPGDTVYIYVTAPYSAILFGCSFLEGGRLKLVRRYMPKQFPLSILKERYGVTSVRGRRGIPESLSEDLLKRAFAFRYIRPEEAERAADIEWICFPPHEACSRKSMRERVKACPDQFLVESKSLKLYMFSFRNHGDFHEDCVNIIMKDLVKLLDPKYIEVEGIFMPRGGISLYPFANYGKPGTEFEALAKSRLFTAIDRRK